ncbi:MAG: ribonuclease PH, partial [Proteobacteria bacterium]|nr:ribonuclease PH [Pseudomonadota bacterium]
MNFRHSGRSPSELRPIKITPHFLSHPPGSCLIEMGGTRVVCSAMIEDSIPNWLKGQGKGWLTAEYSMLPASSGQRIQRERNKIGGRTMEIQRLIGRSLRAAIDMNTLGERSILVDCDVIDADGGTRTASITGSYVAVMLALQKMSVKIPVLSQVAKQAVAAVSVGMVKGTAVLDLDYPEDKDAEVDMNVVMTSEGKFIEVQGTAENEPFDRRSLDQLL